MLSDYKAIYVASTNFNGRPLPNRDELVAWLVRELARAYGGAIATQAGQGSWMTPAGVVLVEPITVVKSYCAPGIDDGRLRALACELKARARQQAVAIETPAGLALV
jgi:hypothetical protein